MPVCWLAGFTDSQQSTGRLWVTDLKKGKQWPTTPAKAGRRRDFYRIATPVPDPVLFEKFLSECEAEFAPVLKTFGLERKPLIQGEFEKLLLFAAIQFVRVPAFRPFILRIADSIQQTKIAEALDSPERWARAMELAGIDQNAPGAGYEDMLDYKRNVLDKGEYSISAENEWYLERGLQAVQRSILPSLMARSWQPFVSPSGNLIGL